MASVRSFSSYFFATSLILALFGIARMGSGGYTDVQWALAVLMAAAGIYLRTGTMPAAVVGVFAASLTATVGATLFLVGHVYIPGTIVAVFAMFRLGDLVSRLRKMPPAAPFSTGIPSAAPQFQAEPDRHGW